MKNEVLSSKHYEFQLGNSRDLDKAQGPCNVDLKYGSHNCKAVPLVAFSVSIRDALGPK